MKTVYILHTFPEELQILPFVSDNRDGTTYVMIHADNVPEFREISPDEAAARLHPFTLEGIQSIPSTATLLAR